MIGKILRGYSAVLGSAVRFVALIGVCIGTGFLLVYPLWTLAVRNPDVYTLLFGIILALLAGTGTFFAVKKAVKAGKRDFFLSLLRKAILIAGIIVFIAMVLSYRMALALISLPVTGLLYGYIAFVVSPKKRTPAGL